MRFTKLTTGFHRLLVRNSYRHYADSSLREGYEVSNNMVSKESYEKYQNSLPMILDKLFKGSRPLSDIEESIRKLVSHTVARTKKFRSLYFICAHELLETPENITKKSLNELHATAWALEMVNSHFEVYDDIIDESEDRWGIPCWYKLPDVRNLAVNDTAMLRNLSYLLLNQNISNKTTLADAVELFDQTYNIGFGGQNLDVFITKHRPGHPEFSWRNYHELVSRKLSHYTFKFPVMVAMLLTNKMSSESMRHLEDIHSDLGILYQVQNDYVDCYANSKVTGTGVGTDIEQGKSTWLALTALDHCNPAQRALFVECYGSKDPAHVEQIKRLYDELHIPQLYENQVQTLHDSIVSKAEATAGSTLKPEVFLKVLDVIERQYEKL